MSPSELLRQAADFHQAGERQKARLCYEFILRFEPDNTEALRLLGLLLVEEGDNAGAILHLQHCLARTPESIEVLHTLGRALRGLACLAEAEDCFRREIELAPDNADAWANLGWTLRLNARPHEALEANRRATHLQPLQPEHWNNLGIAAQSALELDEAMDAFKKASELRPNYAKARLHEGMLRLLQGDWEKGFELYEHRFGMPPHAGGRQFSQPLWTGNQKLKKKTILLHAEQGLGDTLQFVRYAGLFAPLGIKVVLEVQPLLVKFLEQSLRWPVKVVERGATLPAFDFHCPLMSLPYRFGTRPDSVPFAEAYLRFPREAAASWKNEIIALPGPRIGIVWSGNPLYANDRNRSVPLLRFLEKIDNEQASLVVLQKDLSPEDRRQLECHPSALILSDRIQSFSDTAGIMAHLDSVVTVDTSVAHLAGALGVPTKILLPASPDWRWGLGSDKSPWYASATLLRQELKLPPTLQSRPPWSPQP